MRNWDLSTDEGLLAFSDFLEESGAEKIAEEMKGRVSTHPPQEWKWYGYPAHFIGAPNCHFHLATEIGRILVSTVGEYYPPVHLDDSGNVVYSPPDMPQTIGWNRLYETMVCLIDPLTRCHEKGCECLMPEITAYELHMEAANARGEAARNHLKTCYLWADKKYQQEQIAEFLVEQERLNNALFDGEDA